MRLERLVIDSGGRTLSADFHPRLTVIGGLTAASREALAGELVDALAGARPGVHLELRAGDRSLTVFRPPGDAHRVIDTDRVRDVTADHLGPDGEIDLFATAGTTRAEGRAAVRFDRSHLILSEDADRWTARLAAADQHALWSTAHRVRAAEDRLTEVADTTGTSAEDAALAQRIEEHHRGLVTATEGYERTRLISLTLATVGAIGALAGLQLQSTLTPISFVVLSALGLALGVRFRLAVERAARAERDVLAEAGADDYASFHFERVSALLDSDHERRRFMLAVGDHRRALDAWSALAGDAPVSFALGAEERIRAAAEVRSGVGMLHVASTSAPDVTDDRAAQLAQAVLGRIEGIRATGDGSLPLIVDDPFVGLEAALKPVLLELLSHHAGNPQLIVLTADEAVTSWARVEALTGEVAVVEPEIHARRPVPAAIAS